MDTNSAVACLPSADNDVAERMRFESFKLGNPIPKTDMKSTHRHAHSRSLSRNLSVSSSLPGLSFSSVSNSTKPMSETSPPSPPAAMFTTPAVKRNSHHRRRSSVSTRHESADMMGVSVTDLPLSLSDDNINLGDKDSVRRRALWALEGKPDDNSCSKVEIPDISTPELNKKFEIPAKPTFTPSVVGSGFGASISNSASKRDSFVKHLSSSTSVTELHTLVEEDEEEEDKEDVRDDSMMTTSPIGMLPAESAIRDAVVTTSKSCLPSRPRPASLNLRPLSLAKENVIDLGDLPTPASPNLNHRPGLRSLTLTSAPSSKVISTNSDTNNNVTTTNINRRQSLAISSVTPVIASPLRRPSMNIECETNFRSSVSVPSCTDADYAKKRASVSYRCSTDIAYGQFTLPTPEATPTLQRHRSLSSSSAGVSEWSLSETEQHFLYQAHATLVQRISDLERALAVSRSRPQSASCASDTSSRASFTSDLAPLEEPSDEMLQLIADLKVERDELSNDVEGWRVRVSDLDRQVGLLARRVDLERREAWVARERYGLLEVEKKRLEQSLEAKVAELEEVSEKYQAVSIECNEAKQQCAGLKVDLQGKKEIEDECERLRSFLSEEKKKREELQGCLDSVGLMNTPVPAALDPHLADRPPSYVKPVGNRKLGFQSIDSETTDVDVADPFHMHLKSVSEEHEALSGDEENNGLAHYEDEFEDDLSNQGSSLGSLEDVVGPARLRIGITVPTPASIPKSAPPCVPEGAPGHDRRHSLSKTWTFPKGVRDFLPAVHEVDKFFGCLEDLDETPVRASISEDNGRGLFSRSLLQNDDDQSPPFLLPKNVGYEISAERSALDAVVEEDEEEDRSGKDEDPSFNEFNGEVVDGGIIFKFIPPDDSDVSSELMTPSPGPVKGELHILDMHEDENPTTFRFSQSVPITPPPKPCNTKPNSPTPSAIPRAIALRTYTPIKSTQSTGLVGERSPVDAFMTPPTKRGGPVSTFLPQGRVRTVSPVSQAARPTAFVSTRQPQRGNNIPATNPAHNSSQEPALSINARTTAYRYDLGASMTKQTASTVPGVPSAALGAQPPTSASKLTFQSFANLIPSAFSWSPRTAQRVDASLSLQEADPVGQFSFGNNDRKVNRNSKEKYYVSKEKQLEKLRSRLEEEERSRKYAGGSPRPCGRCDDRFVNL